MDKVISYVQLDGRNYRSEKQAEDKAMCLEYIRGQMQDFREFGPDYQETCDDHQQRIDKLDICIGIVITVIFIGSIVILSLGIANYLNLKNKAKKIQQESDRLEAISKVLLAGGTGMISVWKTS